MDGGGKISVEYEISGLQSAAEIAVDHWGIPHIRAQTRSDAFFVQGFNAARERLWQLDIWRKRGLGLLAADFGPGFLAQDRASRLFLYRSDMDAEWAAYGNPEARSIAESFVAGLNAWIDLTERRPALRPPEFDCFETQPARWQAGDIVRIRSHARVNNLLSEEARARVLAEAEPCIDLARKALHPDCVPMIPKGVAFGEIPAAVLDVFRLATTGLNLTPARLAASLDNAWKWSKVGEFGDVGELGSNNWVVSAQRTATGRPILASDPHRSHTLPSLRYVAHITAPGLDIIGAGEPALPGVSIGHNGCAAFGMTIFPMDQEDLFVYETDPHDPNRYGYGGGWETMRIEHERIPVRCCSAQDVLLKFTRHGPVVYEDLANHRAYAVRTVWSEPGSSPYFASLGYLDAKTPNAFAGALRHWSAPSVNQVYADASGNIAWFVAGKSPRRPNWDGLLPVPGDGRYEWDGFVAPEDLPRSMNPAQGFIATANEYNVPREHPSFNRDLCFEWNERFRATRINEMLQSQPRHTIAQSMTLQCDVTSLPARRIAPLLQRVSGSSPELSLALDLLRPWDHQTLPESGAAALFEVWWTRHLKSALLERLVPQHSLRVIMKPGDNETLLAFLEHPDSRFGKSAEQERDLLLASTLTSAVVTCQELLGSDWRSWKWGRLHQNVFVHPLSTLRHSGKRPWRNVGPLPVGGSESTPCYASYRPDDFSVTTGASFRLIVDVGCWDESRAINAPGQSGNPNSIHYDDQAAKWAKGDYVPLLYSRAAVDAATELTISLRPIA